MKSEKFGKLKGAMAWLTPSQHARSTYTFEQRQDVRCDPSVTLHSASRLSSLRRRLGGDQHPISSGIVVARANALLTP